MTKCTFQINHKCLYIATKSCTLANGIWLHTFPTAFTHFVCMYAYVYICFVHLCMYAFLSIHSTSYWS